MVSNGWQTDGFVGMANRGVYRKRIQRSSGFVLSMNKEVNDSGDDDDDSKENEFEYDPRRDSLGRELRGFRSTAWKKDTDLEPGDTVLCKREIPSLGIYENKSYQIKSIYAQSFQESSQTIEKVPLENLSDNGIPPGCDRYITLYNPECHTEPVIVTPEEVGLVSVKSELQSAMWLAIPGFFWVFVAASFYNIYHERTGGSFSDAFWGR